MHNPQNGPGVSAANSPSKPTAIELLAPAGEWDCARAAVENGADAIYFGLDVGFNARARATNFHLDDLPRLMQMLHRQAVRGYVTLNTLVFTDELPRLEEHVRQLVDAGVDAVLVQDLGVAGLLRELCPALEVHASTQMTITSAAAVRMAAELGVRRVVLARELSIKEIRAISAESVLPLEAFVHGALCVAYSGQCLTSESFGGRSANRGQCAQACRLPYELICDGEQRDLGDMKYLLSPQDLAAYDYIDQLIEAGITSMKIEGRLKTPEYVANICQHYRVAIDNVVAGQARRMSPLEQQEMELSFSRGFSPGWLEGCDHKRLVPGLSSAKRGVLVGKITRLRGDAITIDSAVPLATGDGIVLEGDRIAGREIGGRIYELVQNDRQVDSIESGPVEIYLQRGTFQVHASDELVGKKVWKTDDPKLGKRLRASFESPDANKRVELNLNLRVAVGEPVVVQARSADGIDVELQSQHVVEAARKHPLSLEILQEQFSRLGGSVYRLHTMQAAIEGVPMVPLSVLGLLRKQLIAALDLARTQVVARSCHPEPLVSSKLDAILELDSGSTTKPQGASPGSPKPQGASPGSPKPQGASPGSLGDSLVKGIEPGLAPGGLVVEAVGPRLIVLCRSLPQLQQVLDCGIRDCIADFHDLRQYADAVKMAQDRQADLLVSTLRIHKPGEDGLFRMLLKSNAAGWLVRSLAAVEFARRESIRFIADFSLNVANPLTAQQVKSWGAERITVSYDLNRAQLIQLASYVPSSWMEVVIHQHMPMFHMEHCVFCSTLSQGKNKSDCGRPCDHHDVKLRDRVGMEHVLHADIGCRNTLFNAQAQSGAELVPDLLQLGITAFRIELLRDAEADETARLIDLYRELLAGTRTGSEVWKSLRADNRIGVTRGTLDGPKNPLAIL